MSKKIHNQKEEKLIKSKARVNEFGEVNTPRHIVSDMLDLVKDESYKLESTFLEPACGDGNFLVQILERKAETAVNIYNIDKDESNFNRNMFIGVSTIYGIDILADNVASAKSRMMDIIENTYTSNNLEISDDMAKTFKKLLDVNIIWGDSLEDIDKGANRLILFAEWNLHDNIVHRKDYSLRAMSTEHSKTTPHIDDYEKVEFTKVHTIKEKGKEYEKKRSNKVMNDQGLDQMQLDMLAQLRSRR